MDDYDRRQVENMVSQLQAYEGGKIDLSWLISSLESLLGCLEKLPESWRDEFRRHWGLLEEVYSVAVVREQPIESTENKVLIDRAVAGLHELLASALASP